MKTIAAQTASAIRKELRDKYPNIKFRVRSSNFAGGNSVDIEWTDGPKEDDVQKITNKYQYGHFNGMIDMYEFSNSRDDIPQAKFVHTQRNIGERFKAFLIEYVTSKYDVEGYEVDRLRRQLFCETSFPEKMFENLS